MFEVAHQITRQSQHFLQIFLARRHRLLAFNMWRVQRNKSLDHVREKHSFEATILVIRTLHYFSTDSIHHNVKRDIRVAERLKLGILGNIRKFSKFGWRHSLVPSLPSRTQTLPIAVKKYAKTDTKLFFSCPELLDYSILFQIF